MELPDLTNLTLVQIISTLVFFAFIDTAFAYIVAISNKDFNAAYALDFLRTHVLKVGVPILGLAVVGNGISIGGEELVPAIPACTVLAIGSLGIYIIATIASLRDTWSDKAVSPTPTAAVAPVQEQ